MAFTRSLARFLGALAIAALLGAPTASLRAQDDPVIARANGVDIHQSDLALAEDEIAANMPAMTADRKREYLVTYLADIIVLAQAAEQQKLSDDPDVKRQLDFERKKVLMEALLQKAGAAAQTDEALHKVYDEAVKQMGNEQEVHARHILVPTEDEAKAIEAELKNGADFATLAKQKSKDPGGATNGGDLGWFSKDQMVPEFADAAFKLDKGQISDPVHTQVRLAHHPGRGQAHQADADVRCGQTATAELRGAPRASGTGRQLAQDCQDRTPRPAGGAESFAQSRRAGEEVNVVAGLDPAIHAAETLQQARRSQHGYAGKGCFDLTGICSGIGPLETVGASRRVVPECGERPAAWCRSIRSRSGA